MDEKLFIGLDIGTDSVGWAVTDENFKLRRLKGKTAWGARLFSEASDAKSRRTFRSGGRRLARRKERIRLLNTLFDPLLKEKDPTFLLRLEYSMFQNDDENKPVDAISDCPLFINKKEEKEYYKKYPTIWHLRKALLDNDDEAFSDIRLLYLAIHHIIKYRGNFIKTGDNDGLDFDKKAYFTALNDTLKDLFDTQEYDEDTIDENLFVGLQGGSFDEFLKTAEERKIGKQEKKKKLLALMTTDEDSKPFIEMFCTLCTGGTFSTKKLNKKDEEVYGDEKIVFNSSYDENEPKIKDALGDAFALVEIAKAVYDYCDLKDILNGHKRLSDAFVQIYDSHKEELTALKQMCKYIDKQRGFTGDNSIFVQIFNQRNNANNYPAFTHNKTNQKRCDIHTFNGYVMSMLKPYDEELQIAFKNNWEGLKQLAQEDHLLQTIALRSTSVIPNQLHKAELQKILDNAIARKVPGIDEELRDKLIALFKYRIPYYCGPLTTASEYSNVVFFNTDSHERVTPWNYEQLINFDATKIKFMNGLTNKCTYLKNENVLPLGSILYQDFDAWNKLNNLRVNGEKLTLDEANQLFYDNLVYRKKSTLRDIKKILCAIKNTKESDMVLSGLNANDFINCSSRAALSKDFNLTHRYTDDYKLCEDAIFLKTIYCDSPSDADVSIKKKYPNLTDKQYKTLSKLVCKQWATLSEKLLTLKPINQNGEITNMTLIGEIEELKGNFMEVFNHNGYQERVDIENSECFKNLTKQQIANRYIEEMPPKMRRPVIQAMRIVNEISKVAKKEPDTIAIEVTRENNDSKTKKKLTDKAETRKKQIQSFLKNLAKDAFEKERAESVQKELEIQELTALKGKHLYLYFMQNGKDAYSGMPIDINDVLTGNRYDTDHIIPQSMKKDDSIDNLVLVARETNQLRSNKFPLPEEIRCNPQNVQFWRRLKKAGMMSDKKYNNLIRSTPLTDEEIDTFVAAQINVVNHSNVVVRDVLKTLYPNTRLVFSKAQYPSQIRQELMIPKLRDLNDTHHAVDAYLNIVAGVKLTDRFGNMRTIKAIERDSKKRKENGEEQIDTSYNLTRYLNRSLFNYDGTQTDLAKLIDATSRRHDFLLTYRFDYNDSNFYDLTIRKKGEFNGLAPIHENLDQNRYGGYNNLSTELNCIATISTKKGEKRFLLGVPHLLIEKAKHGVDVTNDLTALVPHKEDEIVRVDLNDSLPLAATVKKDGIRYLVYGFNASVVNLKPITPIFLSRKSENYIYALTKNVEKHADALFGNCKEATIFTDRDSNNKIVFTLEQSIEVANELFALVERTDLRGTFNYEYCLMTFKIRSEKFKEEVVNELSTSTFDKQLTILKSIIGLFTRKSETLSNRKCFLKSRSVILQDDITICSESITGLYSEERKL